MKSVKKIFSNWFKPGLFIFLAFITLNATASDERFTKANAFYTAGQFQEAIDIYEGILKSGVESPKIYYNLGNAYYRKGILPSAIINYERALLLAPHDRDIRYNLELAYNHITDKIEPVEEFILNKWFSSLRNSTDSDNWAKVSIALFILFLVTLLFYFFAKTALLRKLSFSFAILFILASSVSFGFSSNQKQKLINRNRAIIMAPSVTVRSSPDNSGTEIFVLHEGTRVRILKTIGKWHEIELEDGNIGWTPIETLEII